MTGSFPAAVRAVLTYWPGKNRVRPSPETVVWDHATLGVVILVVVVMATLGLNLIGQPLELLPYVFVPLAIALTGHAVAFAILGLAGFATQQAAKLPAAVLLLALLLVVLQLLSIAFATLKLGPAVPLGVMGYFYYLSARNGLDLRPLIAIGLALLMGLATVGSGMMLAQTPLGQAVMGGI